ncbi:MAG: amino acid adenylation domain-containing protein [Pelobium sp.]
MKSELTLVPVDYNPFKQSDIEKVGFTNESQKEIFLSSIIGGDNANRAYNECFTLQLTGLLNIDVLKKAVHQIFKQHEALRSNFSANGEYVFVNQFKKLDLNLVDISVENIQNQKLILEKLYGENVDFIFDLLNGPLVKIDIYKTAADIHQFIITVHHIIADGWSVGIILQHLSKIYSANIKGEEFEFSNIPQMTAYAEEEKEYKKSANYEKTLDFWTQQFSNFSPFGIPTDFPPPSYRNYESNRVDLALDQKLTTSLKNISKQEKASFINVLLISFEVLLYEVTAEKEIIVGLPSAGQSATGNYDLVGHCVNLLPLKATINPDLTFVDYLKKRKSELLEALENQYITFGSLLKSLNLVRDPSRVALVPVVFNVDLGLDDTVNFSGLDYEFKSNPRHYETFELFVNLSGHADNIVIEWTYNTNLYKEETIQRFHQQYEAILNRISAQPSVLIKDLIAPIVTEHIAITPVHPQVNYPLKETIPSLFFSAVEKYKNKTALTFEGKQWSYQQLNEQSNQLAHTLMASGIKKGEKIGVAVKKDAKVLITFLAILKCGAVFLPIDPEYPLGRIQFILEDVDAKLLITTKEHIEKFNQSTLCVLLEELIDTSKEQPVKNPSLEINGEDLAYILHTSGSTGNPKGVEIRHKSLINVFYWVIENLKVVPEDKIIAITSVSFDIAYIELLMPLLAGAEIILTPSEVMKDGRLILDILQNEKISIMQATPSTWQMLIDAGWDKKLPIRVISGGEALSRSLASEIGNLCLSFWNLYGPTETSIYSSGKKINNDTEIITIGRPIANTLIYILNERLQAVNEGTIGEIFIEGAGLAKGYYNNEKLTADKFIANPFKSETLIYKTGDLGRLLNGEIQLIGRSDEQIKIRGLRIEPQEIEHHLKQQENIAKAVVDKVKDFLVAFVILKKEEKGKVKKWSAALKEILPAYMVPQKFIIVNAFPLTPNGKVDKIALQQLAIKQLLVNSQHYLAPKTPAQKLLATIWKELLQLEKVSILDNFFELGGHSLIAVSLMVMIENETGKRLPIASLFENSTIQSLAKLLEDNEHVSWNSLVPIKPTGNKTPLYIIHGSGLNVFMFHSIINLIDPERPVYGIQAIGLDGTDVDLNSIEEIASIYISDIEAQNPNGPYAILGYSLGGMIAVEMLKQLTAAGKQVEFFGMIDTYVDNVVQFDGRGTQLIKKIFRQFPKALFIIKSFFKHPIDVIRYQFFIIKSKILSLFGKDEKMISEEQTFQEQIYKKYEDAYNIYKLEPIDQPIFLFKVKKRLYYLDDPKFLGWKPFAKNGLNIYDLPGDHKTFILDPFNKRFVKILQKALKDAENSIN